MKCHKLASSGVYIGEGAPIGGLTVTIHAVKSVEQPVQADFEVVFARHWSRVHGLLFRLVGDQAQAEDLALEVFWRYYQHPPVEQDPQKLGGWLYRVAVRMGYNALRAENRRRNYEDAAGKQELQGNKSLDAEDLVERAEQRRLVHRILAQMKPRAAQILVLRYAGCSYAEIAATLKITPGNVGTLLSRAEVDFQKRFERIERGG